MDDKYRFMAAAIEEMKKGTEETKVGAVIERDGQVLATGFRTKDRHAERVAIETAKSNGVNLAGATLYATLEPCVRVNPKQSLESCAELIVASGIERVYIGRYDPNPAVKHKGWEYLKVAGVDLKDFPLLFRKIIDDENGVFMNSFERRVGPAGGAKICHKDLVKYTVQYSEHDTRKIEIQW